MNIDNINTVTVIGAGDMGHGIAECALLAGYKVYLTDINQDQLQRGIEKIHVSLDKLGKQGKINQETIASSKNNLHSTIDLKSAVSQAQFVFEAVPEVLSIKQNLFKKLDEYTSKDTILATNTSNMVITEVAKFARYKDRIVGTHFFNPVVIMEVVEVIKGQYTSEEAMQGACDMCTKMRKVPIRIEKESPSFIVNRVNGVLRVFLGAVVDRGIAEPEEIDAMMRYHGKPIGHFELSDYAGLDVVYDSLQYRKKALHPEYEPYQSLVDKVQLKQFGKKTGKGFYDWSNGRPVVDVNKRTTAITIDDIEFVKFNEAAKLVEEGVSNVKDINLAMTLANGEPEGPFQIAQRYELNEVINRLEYLSEKLGKEILRPTSLLLEESS